MLEDNKIRLESKDAEHRVFTESHEPRSSTFLSVGFVSDLFFAMPCKLRRLLWNGLRRACKLCNVTHMAASAESNLAREVGFLVFWLQAVAEPGAARRTLCNMPSANKSHVTLPQLFV